MKKIIESINNGQFDKREGKLVFSCDSVELAVGPGGAAEGSFIVQVNDHGLVEGTVYCDDYRMECITTEFSGRQDEISYRFQAGELSEGSSVQGNFFILSNRGEYRIPFNAHIDTKEIGSSLGPIKNLFHFANLAKANWDEAIRIFYSPEFEKVIRESDVSLLPMYRCLSGVTGSDENMDEFLISIRKKTPVEYLPSEKTIEVNDPVGSLRFSLNISRNGWGFTRLNITTEGDFLDVDKNDINQDDFLGNNYLAYYYIDSDKLHAGKNYGEIILKDSRYTTRIPVMVTKTCDTPLYREMSMNRRKGIAQMMDYYQAFRLKKISSRIWLSESEKIVQKMLMNDPADLLARLYQIHIMETQERFNEANWNLKSIKAAAESVRTTQVYLWDYYLYLCTLSDSYERQWDDFIREVEMNYRQNPADWRIAWMLSYMSPDYKTATKKWVMYRKSYNNGCISPVMYLEAARILLDNPALLTELGSFEIQVLRFICKKSIMTDELMIVLQSMAERCREYSEYLVRLLMACYAEDPHDELLSIICTQLIKGNRRDAQAFRWYGYAVKQELKITRLYEYYMLSLDISQPAEIPRTVLMYFSFQSDLDYERNAYLYCSVLENRDNDPGMYSKYATQMKDFVCAQLEAGHNNRYLTRLYKAFIDDSMLSDEAMASKIADVIFMHEIDVSAYSDIKYVVLGYGHRDGEKIYPVNGMWAEIPVYSSDYCVALEDSDKRRYVLSKPVEVKELMPPGRLLLDLQLNLRNSTALDVHCCMEHQHAFDIRNENEFRFASLLRQHYFSKEYEQSITMKLIRFYYDQDRIEDLDRFLENLDADSVSVYERAECLKIMVTRNHFLTAMDWVYRFGPENVDLSVIASLIYGWLPANRDDPGKYARLLVQLMLMTQTMNASNKVCLQYLGANAVGSLKTLKGIWENSRKAGVDCRDLEERMIIQQLFTGAYISNREDILSDYAHLVPDGDILRAAVSQGAYEYFVLDTLLSDRFFEVMTECYETDIELQIICALAYVRHFAENRDAVDERVKPVLKNALHILLGENIVLACFKELADIMPSMAIYGDSMIIEYRTVPGYKATIHYIFEGDSDGEYTSEPMNEVYEGVYSKMFTLFFGERLMYYITEGSSDDRDMVSESHTIARGDIDEGTSQEKFGIINDICIGKTLHDYATVDNMLEEYYRSEFLSKKLFGMHKD